MLVSGFPAELGKPGDLNFICPGPETVWNLSQKVEKNWTKQEISQTTWIKPGMSRYTKFQFYIENFLIILCTPCKLSPP